MSIRQLMTWLFLIVGLPTISFIVPQDPDMWWHIRAGEYVAENGIPKVDPGFSYTVNGKEWFMHEWLSDLVMYKIYDWTGWLGLTIVFMLLLWGTFVLLYWRLDGKPYIATFLCFIGIILCAAFGGIRPQLFNIFFGAVFVALIDAYRVRQLPAKWLWILVPITLLWANMHSGFLFGITVLIIYGVGGIIDTYLLKNESYIQLQQVKLLMKITLGCGLISMLNPQTYKLWLYPVTTTLFNPAMQAFINEWQSPDFHKPFGLLFAIMLLGGLVAMIYSGKHPSVTELLLFIGAGTSGLVSARNVPLFIIVALPIINTHLISWIRQYRLLQPITGDLSEPTISSTLKILNVGLAIVTLVAAFAWRYEQYTAYDQLTKRKFPVQAVDFLEERELTSVRIYNLYHWGGYLIWRRIPVFIDGRADLYGNEFITQYTIDIEQASGDWEQLLAQYQVEIVLTSPYSPLANRLELHPDWKKIYTDDISEIFQLKSSQVQEKELFGG